MSVVTCVGTYRLTTQAEVNNFVDATTGLPCTSVTGSLTVGGSNIQDLSPLDSITEIGGSLTIGPLKKNYKNLENIFDGLTDLGGGVDFRYYDPNIVSIDGFHNLEQTGDYIDFIYFKELESVTGFENLHTCGWSMEFSGNPKLKTLPNFPALTTFGSSLFIYDNDELAEITGFNALTYVDWSLWIDNLSLTSLCGLKTFFSIDPYTGNGYEDIYMQGATLSDSTFSGHKNRIQPAFDDYIINAGCLGSTCSADADCGFNYCISSACAVCGASNDPCETDDHCCGTSTCITRGPNQKCA